MPWGEKVRWVPVGKDKFQLDKWLDGLFLALEDESEMFWIGTPEGTFKTRTVKRQDPEKSSDVVFFNSIVGAPWMLKPKEDKPEKEIKIRSDVLTSTEDKPEVSYEFKTETSVHTTRCRPREVRHHHARLVVPNEGWGVIYMATISPPSAWTTTSNGCAPGWKRTTSPTLKHPAPTKRTCSK